MRRVIAVAASLILALLGTWLLVRYVQGAEDRALEGEEVVDVWVVDDPIARGSTVEEVTSRLRSERVPQKVVADGVVIDVAELEGYVAAIDLIPGEQLVTSRFITREEYLEQTAEGPKVDVPPDKLEVTVSVTPDRAVGGELRPGEQVAVFASFDPFALSAIEPTDLEEGDIPIVIIPTTEEQPEEPKEVGARTPNSTQIILHKVLVTNVQAEELPRKVEEGEVEPDAPDLAPTGNLLITLALDPVDAERFVFTAEHGFVWLAREGVDVDEAETEIQTRATVYK